MKRFFNVLLVAIVIAAFAVPGFTCNKCAAHTQKDAQKKVACHATADCCDMLKELKLTDKQKTKIEELKKEFLPLKKKLHDKCAKLADAKGDVAKERAKLHADLEKIMKDCHAKIKTVLTPEQQKKMDKIHAKCIAECQKKTAHCATSKTCAKTCDKKKACCTKAKTAVKKVAKVEKKEGTCDAASPDCPQDCKHLKKK